ncbi:hypothetical protein HYX08_01270 [Candidatus Woesearchaeota archaeon]|nr:hypothetical protein [Candidatus Woesearchaeota archaeon]
MSIAGAMHSVGLDKLIPKLKNYALARGFYDEIKSRGGFESSYSPWQQVAAAGLAMGAYASATPAIVRAEESTKQATDENLRLYNYAFGAGKVVVPKLGFSLGGDFLQFRLVEEMFNEHTAVVRLARDGIEYSVVGGIPNNFYGIGYEADRGFIAYDKLESTRRDIEKKDRNKTQAQKALGALFIKHIPTSDDFKRDIIRQMQEFALDDEYMLRQDMPLPLPAMSVKIPESARQHFLPSASVRPPQIPERPSQKLEDLVTDGYLELKEGTVYYKKAEDGLLHYRWLSGNVIEKEGIINLKSPAYSSLQARIGGGVVNHVRDKLQKQEEQYQAQIKKFGEEYKGFLLSIAPYTSKDELDKINFGFVAQGFIPVFVEDNQVLALQFSGRYSKVSNGENILQGALGFVFNRAIDADSAMQFSIVYQGRYDAKKDAYFGAVAGTLGIQTGNTTIDFYVSKRVTGPQKVGSERTARETESVSTSGGITTTQTTRIESIVKEYEELRNVISLNFEHDFRDSPVELLRTLKLRGGVVRYSGREDKTTEIGNVKKIVEGYSEEFKAALGFTYVLDGLSRILDRRVEVFGDVRFGIGKGETFGEAGVRTWLGESYAQYLYRISRRRVDLYRMARWLDLVIGQFKVTEETTTKSPEIKNNCSTETEVGNLYKCEIEAVNGKISKIKVNSGPSSLALSDITETKATYSGTTTVNDIGSHTVEIEIEGSPKTFVKYTLKVNDVSSLSAEYSVNPTSGTAPLATTHNITITGGKSPYKITYDFTKDGTIDATVDTSSASDSRTSTYNSGTFTSEATIEDKLGRKVTKTKTITASAASTPLPTVTASNQTINEGSTLELIIGCENCASSSASNLPLGASYTASTLKLSWTPDKTQGTQNYTVTFSGTNSAGTANKTITITVNNLNPTISFVSPANDTTIIAGGSVTFEYSTDHPFSVTVTTNKTTVAGTCPDVPSGKGPSSVSFPTGSSTCDYSGTADDGAGGTATTVTRRVTINAAPPPPPG